MNSRFKWKDLVLYTDGVATPKITLVREAPCRHQKGCFDHTTHPCEGCGFTGGEAEYIRKDVVDDLIDEAVKASLGYM